MSCSWAAAYLIYKPHNLTQAPMTNTIQILVSTCAQSTKLSFFSHTYYSIPDGPSPYSHLHGETLKNLKGLL